MDFFVISDATVAVHGKNLTRGESLTSVADDKRPPLILIVEGVEEIRDGLEKLLSADGYRVNPARNEAEARERAGHETPDLILLSRGGSRDEVIATASRLRERTALPDSIPIVIFCVATVPQGAEVKSPGNIYLTRPDNFDQLRRLLRRLLAWPELSN